MPRPTGTLLSFIKTNPKKMEVFRFDDQDKATAFGRELKEIARKEENAPSIFDLTKMHIEIGHLTVRARAILPVPSVSDAECDKTSKKPNKV
jgi:hypothetical protein